MLRLENITFSYDKETEALKDITLNIEKGRKTLFLGENGSGKSTLFLIMNGLLKAQKGNIYFEEKKIEHKKKNLEELRKKVGIIFQDPEIQIFAPLVFQEVAYGPENLGYSEEKVEENVNRAMKEINIEDLKDRPCHHLSYGQKKRVSIAAITAMEPELLILDEPTAWLDSKNTKRVSEILDNFSEAGKTLVVSTHDTDFAYEFADYIYVLDKGKIVRQGSRDEVFEDFEFLKKFVKDWVEIKQNLQEVYDIYKNKKIDFCIAMRLHSMILSQVYEIEYLWVSYSLKTEEALKVAF